MANAFTFTEGLKSKGMSRRAGLPVYHSTSDPDGVTFLSYSLVGRVTGCVEEAYYSHPSDSESKTTLFGYLLYKEKITTVFTVEQA